ncbi:MAG: pyridoxal phosphate-dependent aminotransferase [Muribaculaceae bacterium]|nr:pyridoxal phosphate-dependent aminotransferase [Bacteroidales bacterium]MDY4810724.1 pyridoxal phosphate-dependent aminotransferase [Muribaculaceae bacterium]
MEQSFIADRIKRLAESATLAMSQKSSELRAAGVDVINLSVGEPDFPTPDHIKLAAISAVENNFSHYSPVPGYLSLREAIADKLSRENHASFTPAQIVVGTGAKQELSNTIMAVVNPGDEVIIPVPAWVSYVEMVKLAEGTPVLVQAEMSQGFKVTPEQLEAAITPRTRVVLICSPSNPTGAVYTREEIAALVEVLRRHPQVLILSDEIYEHINYTPQGHVSFGEFPEIADRLVIVNGVSKAYAMTGWRIGYMAGPAPVAKAVSKLQGQTTSGTSTIAQKAAEAAYRGAQECVEQMREAFRRRRDLIVGLAREIPGLELDMPSGAFYIFPCIKSYLGKSYTAADGTRRTISTDTEMAMYLLEEAHVATVAGSAFFLPGYIRLSYAAAEEQLTAAMARISDALARLK